MNTAFIATILTYSIHGSILLASLLVATMIARQQYKLSWLAALIKAMVTMASVKISTGMSLPKTMALKAFLALLITLGSLLGSSDISVAITRPGEDAEGNINVAHSMKLALTTFSADTNAYEYPKQAHKCLESDDLRGAQLTPTSSSRPRHTRWLLQGWRPRTQPARRCRTTRLTPA